LTLITIAYGTVLGVRLALYAARHVVPSSLRPFVESANYAQVWLFGLDVILGLVWLHRGWAQIPPSARRTYDGRAIEPGEAVAKLFIPIYNLFWLFTVNIGLCAALENWARQRSIFLRAPSAWRWLHASPK
jgi:hypothetical protein